MTPEIDAKAGSAPRFAVLLPVYNGAPYLRQSIDSVLRQTLRDFELLICDDASSDESPEILASFNDPRIRRSRHEVNRGLFPTLNELVRSSSAPLVHLWSQDDIMLADCLQRHAEFHAAHPEIVMSYSAVRIIDETGRIVEPEKRDQTPDVISPELATQLMFHHGSITGNIANVVMTQKAFATFGSFREDLTVSADFEMWVRLTRKDPIGHVRQPVIELRRHSQQFSRRSGSELAFIRQNRAILDELLARLPRAHARAGKRYLVAYHHRSYAHAAVRSVLRRDLATAASILEELRSRDSLVPALLYWLVTGNGRWWPRPRALPIDQLLR